ESRGVCLYMAATKPTPDESEGKRLLDEFESATERYTWAVNELTRQRETAHLEDYDKIARYVEDARVEVTEALPALQRFRSEHRKRALEETNTSNTPLGPLPSRPVCQVRIQGRASVTTGVHH